MFGILFLILGVLAEYIGLIYEEIKQRPNFVVRREVGIHVPEDRAMQAQRAVGVAP